jgi:hypothetical protein
VTRIVVILLRALAALCLAAGLSGPAAAADWVEWRPLTGPCDGNCAAAVYAGWYVEEGMSDIFVSNPETPLTWTYAGDHLVAGALTRRIATLWRHVDIEPEFGIGKRFGKQSETEIWGAFFFRWRGFPWDDKLITTVAVSTGMNFVTHVSDVEQERARDGKGDRWMHFFAPEITFALPSHPDVELLFRLHHRSGVFGLVSDAWGGAQYATIGLRFRF